jgi:Zn finger protein HypA/HybF involved in hydrogenase expression
MHETVFARKIIEDAEKQGNVTEVYVELGELAPVPPHELLECLRSLVPWRVDSRVKQASVKCTCGFSGRPKILERGHDFFFIECPECGQVPELIDGKDVKIISVKVKQSEVE